MARLDLIAFAVAAATLAAAVNPLVDVGYTKYLGTALPNGVSQWLGVRYAAPPLGDRRFRAPANPLENKTVQLASEHGAVCLGSTLPFPFAGTNEDCLFLDIYAPSDATPESRLPVFFFIQGGGFILNANPNFNGTSLVQAADFDMIVVNFNYRVGIFGFLASQEVQANGTLNVGLWDQRKAMEWVQEHISKFGGNPNHVVLGGISAGAMSILVHLTAFGGAPTNLFHAVAGESAGFFTQLTLNQSQFLYDIFVENVGCNNRTDTLECLRQTDVSVLQAANQNIPYPGRSSPPLFVYMPVIDGELVPDFLHRSFAQGKFIKTPTIFGDDTNEGSTFAPMSINNTAEMSSWLVDQFPFLTSSMVSQIVEMYPKAEQFPGVGPFFTATSAAYGDLFYVCTGISISSTVARARVNQPNWLYSYNVEDPSQAAEFIGVPHTVEVNAIFGPENTNGAAPPSYFPGQVNAAIVPEIQGYWTSFIRTMNPNSLRAAGSPLWQEVGKGTVPARLLFQTNATQMETVPTDQMTKCDFFNSIALRIQQ